MSKIYKYAPNFAVLKCIPDGCRTILDIGCGNGGITDYIPPEIKVDGITFSKDEFDVSTSKLDTVYLHNLENGLPNKVKADYDVIIASHLIEHIAYPEKLLHDLHSIMTKDTIFIVALPNIMFYKYRIKLFFGNFDYADTGVMDHTHLRWYTFKSAKQLFEKHNFKVLKIYADSKLPFYRLTRLLPKKLQHFLSLFLFFISKGFFGMQMILVLKK